MTPTHDHPEQITLYEVYRAVQALDARVSKSFDEFERSQHSLRNKQQATDLQVAVLKTEVQNAKAVATTMATTIATVLSTAAVSAVTWLFRRGI